MQLLGKFIGVRSADMKIRHQALTAGTATAILLAATSGIFLSTASRSSFAEPISPEALQALQAAVSNPTGDLQAIFAQMDAASPGSSQTFIAAVKSNTDTVDLASAMQNLVAVNGALTTTIESALSTLSADPRLASVETSGGAINVSSLVSTVNTSFQAALPPAPTGNANASGGQPSVSDAQKTLADLNPAAPGGTPLGASPPGGSQLGSPFTRPGSNPGASPGDGNAGPPTGINTGPGKPNSRA
jgi:hypothetical protein